MFAVSTHSRKYVLSITARILLIITALPGFLSVSVPGQVITKSLPCGTLSFPNAISVCRGWALCDMGLTYRVINATTKSFKFCSGFIV